MTTCRASIGRALRAVGLCLGLALTLVACGQSQHASGPATSGPATTGPATTSPAHPASPPTAPPTTRPPATAPPTTVWKASAPQASPDAAASRLVGAWAGGDRAIANSVATPAAVTTLFAVTYPGPGLAIPRGCSAAFPPLVCTYGPPGGANPNDAIFEIMVSQTAGGWYVSSVQVLG